MSQLAKGMKWLGKTMASHNSSGSDPDRTVEYVRGTTRITIAATFGESEFETTDNSGQYTQIRTRDFLANTDQLVIDGDPFEPESGDRIVETLDFGTHSRQWLYDVWNASGRLPFEYTDQHRTRTRIFTRRRATKK